MTAAVLVGAGLLRLGGVADLISKPVLTGFLFGLGLTVAVGQLPKLLGVSGGDGDFFEQLWHLLGDLGDVKEWTLAVGAASAVALVVLPRLSRRIPATLVVLVLSIALSKALDLTGEGVDVVGSLPSALPDPAIPHLAWRQVTDLLPAAFGVMLLACAEGIGVARSAATAVVTRSTRAASWSPSAAPTCSPASRADSCRRAAQARRLPRNGQGGGRKLPRSSRPGSSCSPGRSSRRCSRTCCRRRSGRS